MWKIARSLRFARSISQYALPLRPFQHHSLLHPYLHRQSRVLQCRWLSCAYIPTRQPSLFQSSQPDYRQDIQTGKSIRDYRLWFRYDERVERNHWQWRDFESDICTSTVTFGWIVTELVTEQKMIHISMPQTKLYPFLDSAKKQNLEKKYLNY